MDDIDAIELLNKKFFDAMAVCRYGQLKIGMKLKQYCLSLLQIYALHFAPLADSDSPDVNVLFNQHAS